LTPRATGEAVTTGMAVTAGLAPDATAGRTIVPLVSGCHEPHKDGIALNMERTTRDDITLTLCFVVGAAVGTLVLGADAAFSEGLAVGGLAMAAAGNAHRVVGRQEVPHGDE
jgi:hypothetical protein